MGIDWFKLACGSKTKILDYTVRSEMEQTPDQPTIYLCSHYYSLADVLIVSDMLDRHNKDSGTIRRFNAICNTSKSLERLNQRIVGTSYPSIEVHSINARKGRTSDGIGRALCRGEDVVLFQHPYNDHKSLYYIIQRCIEHGIAPRIMYVDIRIMGSVDPKTVNSRSIPSILYAIRNETYVLRNKIIDYPKQMILDDRISREFNAPIWDSASDM